MAKRKIPYLQLSLLSLLLIVAPAFSYIYLKWGYDYRLESLSELADYGKVHEALSYERGDRDAIDVLFVPGAASDSVTVAVKLLMEAFQADPRVRFIALGTEQQVGSLLTRQITALNPEADVMRRYDVISEADTFCQQVPISHRGLVTDTAGVVRRCYDLTKGVQVNRVVEQINILLPRKRKEDIFVSEQQEY